MIDQATQLRELVNQSRSSGGEESDSAVVVVNDQGSVRSHVSAFSCSPRKASPMSIGPAQAAMEEAVAEPEPRAIRPSTSAVERRRVRLARAIAICSGKGGVGKSNIAVSLAVRMAQMGLKVCLLDGDLGLANADVLCSLSPRITLEHVISGRHRLAEAMMLAPGGFRLIPGASGVARMADLSSTQRSVLLRQLVALERAADIILIDCGAGINANVLGFAAAANTALVIATPEPTAITDAYGMIKSLVRKAPDAEIELLVNMVRSEEEARRVFSRISRVSRTFLGSDLEYAGSVPLDSAVMRSVRQRMPVSLWAPESAAAHSIGRLARKLLGLEICSDPITADSQQESRRETGGFFSRLSGWFARSG